MPADRERPSEDRPSRSRPLRPVLIALALLVALDLVLRSPLFPVFPDTFRFLTASTSGFDEFLTFQSRRAGVRVAVLGDSVVQGWQVQPSQTSCAALDRLYEARGRKVNVHNFGLAAAKPIDVANVAERVARAHAVDVAVVEFDYLSYGASGTVAAYPAFAGAKRAPKKPEASMTASLDAAVSGLVDRVWRLAGWREYLGAALLEDFPGYLLKDRLVDAEGKVTLSPRPPQLEASEFNPVLTKKAWDVPELGPRDERIVAFRRTVEAFRAAGVPVVVYVGPLNRELGDELHVYDARRYAKNLALVRSICASEGVPLADLSDAVPPEEMIDSLHLMPAGHERLARRLESVIETQVAAAERERGVAR